MAIPHACFVQPELEFMRSCCLYSVYFQRQDFIKSNNTSGRPKLSLLVSYRKLQYVLVLEEELFPRNLPGYRGQKHMNMLSEIDLYLNHQTEYIFHRKLLGHMYIWHTQRIFQLFSQVRIEGLMRRDYGLFFFFFSIQRLCVSIYIVQPVHQEEPSLSMDCPNVCQKQFA